MRKYSAYFSAAVYLFFKTKVNGYYNCVHSCLEKDINFRLVAKCLHPHAKV